MKRTYNQEQVSIRVACRTDLNKAQKLMSVRMGFKLTQNQVIQRLLRLYIEEKPK